MTRRKTQGERRKARFARIARINTLSTHQRTALSLIRNFEKNKKKRQAGSLSYSRRESLKIRTTREKTIHQMTKETLATLLRTQAICVLT